MKRKKAAALQSEESVSSTDQTGLMPALPEDEEALEAYEALYPTAQTPNTAPNRR